MSINAFSPAHRRVSGAAVLAAFLAAAPARAHAEDSDPATATEAAPAPRPQLAEATSGSARVGKRHFRAVFAAEGVLVPVEATEISFEPKVHSTPVAIVEVLPHGTTVKKDDLILRLDDEGIRDAVKAAEWALEVAEQNVADARIRQQEYEEDTLRETGRAKEELERAEKALHGYKEVDRPLEDEEHLLSRRALANSIEDQEEEIRQLGKMYKEDELTEETEEIVLKRSKRNLEESKKRLELYQRRHAYNEQYVEPTRRRTLELALEDKERSLRDLKRSRASGARVSSIEFAKLEHGLATERKELERLREDLGRFAVRAPHDGIVLHGAVREKVALNILHVGMNVSPRQTMLTVAKRGPLEARFTLSEKDRFRLPAGSPATIVPVALPDMRIAGSLQPISGFPAPDNTWTGRVSFGHEDERLQMLLRCQLEIVVADCPDAIVVPVGAVFGRGDCSVCYLRGEGPFGIVARPVVTGPSDGKDIVIRSGLKEGEEVLLEEPRS